MRLRLSLFLATIISVFMIAGGASAQLGGAIFTSLSDGTLVNQNLYDQGQDVYLNGGPQNENAAGLDDGVYFFQVTTPNGALLLSTTPAVNRLVRVVNGRFAFRCDINGNQIFFPPETLHPEGTGNAANGSVPVQLWPFNQTTNNGGEYKAWAILKNQYTSIANDGIHLNFRMRDVKTDNFKIKTDEPPPPAAALSGVKFYDANMNGIDDGEPGIEGFVIKIILDGDDQNPIYVTTGPSGAWELADVPGGTTYEVCEVHPSDDPDDVYGPGANPNWIQTAPALNFEDKRCYNGTVTGDVEGLDFGNIAAARLSGLKFYDSNGNGVQDDPGDEPPIEGFKIVITATTPEGDDGETIYTDENGEFESKLYPDGTSYTVEEVLPPAPPTWVQTAPASGSYSGMLLGDPPPYTVEYTIDDVEDLIFGNFALGAGGGRTLGFWSNRNGQRTMEDNGSLAPELALLNGFALRNAIGTDMTFANYSAFRNWLLSASATNMAYMLSAQFAAMTLNVEAGFVDPNAVIYAPGTASANAFGFATVGAVLAEAAAALAADGLTLTGDPNRAIQTALKNALDAANNNTNFILAPITFVPHPY